MTVLRTLMRPRERAYPPELNDGGLFGGSMVDLLGFFGRNTAAGVRIDHEIAMTLSAVYRAVWIISAAIATQPVKVYRKDSSGRKVSVIDKPRYRVFRRPNPEVPNAVFWFTVASHEVQTGNAFLYAVTDAAGIPVEMWPIEPHRVRVGRDPKTAHKVYVIDNETVQADFYGLGGNIVHIMGMSSDGLRGVSPIERGAQSMGIGLAAERYAAGTLGKGATPGGILTTEQILSPQEAQAAAEGWERLHAGPQNAGKVAVFGKGTKWMPTTLNPQDAQLLETRKFQVSDVERWFGVPPHLMFDVEKTTSWGSGIAEQGDAFHRYTLNPHTTVIEQTVSDALLPAGVHLDFDASALLRGNFQQQVLAVTGLVRAGFDPAESLAAVGMDPIEHTGNAPVGAPTPNAGDSEAPPAAEE